MKLSIGYSIERKKIETVLSTQRLPVKRKFATGLKKNNLQVIALLLDPQADKFKNRIGVTSSKIIDVSGEVRVE